MNNNSNYYITDSNNNMNNINKSKSDDINRIGKINISTDVDALQEKNCYC